MTDSSDPGRIPGTKSHPDLVYFDSRFVALQQEMCKNYWAVLRGYLANHSDIDVQLAQIASYIEVALDGIYERHDLCRVLCGRMKELRHAAETIVVNEEFPNHPGLIWLPPDPLES